MQHPNDQTMECPKCKSKMIKLPSAFQNDHDAPVEALHYFWCGNCDSEYWSDMTERPRKESEIRKYQWQVMNQPTNIERANATILELQEHIDRLTKAVDESNRDKQVLNIAVSKLQSKLDKQQANWKLRGDPYDYGDESDE